MIQFYIYIYPFFFRFFSHIGYYRILSRVPCAIILVSFKIRREKNKIKSE